MKITDKLDLRNCDCMELMQQYPDKYFDLAVVDPPYGIIGKASLAGGAKLKIALNLWTTVK
jgi:site-specific DNA-methyltransferase (adenine-specific)